MDGNSAAPIFIFSALLQLGPEGDPPGRFHAVELHHMGPFIPIHIQNRAGAEHGVLHPLADGKDDSAIVFRKIPLAVLHILSGLPDQPLLGLLGKVEELLINVQNKP